MTIDEKYQTGNMSAFERKVYEYQQGKMDAITERLVNLRANSGRTTMYYVDKAITSKHLMKDYLRVRGYLTASICKECKCKRNTEVNMDTIKRNLEYRGDLAQILFSNFSSEKMWKKWEHLKEFIK